MNGTRNMFPDYGPARGGQGPNEFFPPLFPPEGDWPGGGKKEQPDWGVSRSPVFPPSSESQPTPASSVPLLSKEQMEIMLRRQEARWDAIEEELAWCWDWKKVAAGWKQLVDLDRRFFPQRFREYVAEILDNARYIPHYALEVVLDYCLHQSPVVQKMYADLWMERLKTEKWANWQQQTVIEEYLNRCFLQQKQEHVSCGDWNAKLGDKSGAKEWWEKIWLEQKKGIPGAMLYPAKKDHRDNDDVEIQELSDD